MSMSNKWQYDPEDDESEDGFEKFWDRGIPKKPPEYIREDNRKDNKPPRKRDEIEPDGD